MSISVSCRKDLPNLLPDNAVGVELGIFECGYSRELLASGKFRLLFIVDPFLGEIIGSGDKDGLNMKNVPCFKLVQIATQLAVDNPGKVTFVRKKGVEFLESIAADSLDFVYIDTTHSYADTLAELEASWRCVKKGGVISGHDLNLHGPRPPVERAVKEFCAAKGVDYHVADGDLLHSFYIFKP